MSHQLHEDPERLQDDLAGYALAALDPRDAAALELHLEDCDSCRERLRWLDPAIAVLPASVEQISPPAALRERLMETVREEAVEQAPAAAPERRAAADRSSWWQGFGALVMRPAAGFAVVVLLIAGAATGYLLRGDDSEPQSTFVEAKPTRGTPPGVSATLERHGDSATLHVNQMPELDRDEVYEVWIQRGGVMEPASTFILAKDGSAEAAVPGPLKGAEGVYVTAEPHPGTQKPTSPPLLSAEL